MRLVGTLVAAVALIGALALRGLAAAFLGTSVAAATAFFGVTAQERSS